MARLALSALLALSIGITVAFSSPGTALGHEMPCWERETVLAKIPGAIGQVPAFVGYIDGDRLMEVWLSPGGGWTVGITYPTGLFCVLTVGSDWRPAPAGEPGEPS